MAVEDSSQYAALVQKIGIRPDGMFKATLLDDGVAMIFGLYPGDDLPDGQALLSITGAPGGFNDLRIVELEEALSDLRDRYVLFTPRDFDVVASIMLEKRVTSN